ncbi:MAG TPA: LysE family translocator [Steroidobacteraceae bacterium]|jgi:threonine/homoserine/homoserine lactone efflux protein
MNPHLFAAFCLAVALLVVLPGPIVTLVVANSLRHGRRVGFATVAGASLGNAILLGATAVGLVTFFAWLSEVFEIVRWVGAAYLIWLGIKAWRGPGTQETTEEAANMPRAPSPSRTIVLQGFLIAITNPKAILFYIAFLPQFLDPHLPAGPQLLLMSATMIVMALISDSGYALLASRARGWFVTPGRRRLQGRISGGLLIGVGCGLLAVRRGS